METRRHRQHWIHSLLFRITLNEREVLRTKRPTKRTRPNGGYGPRPSEIQIALGRLRYRGESPIQGWVDSLHYALQWGHLDVARPRRRARYRRGSRRNPSREERVSAAWGVVTSSKVDQNHSTDILARLDLVVDQYLLEPNVGFVTTLIMVKNMVPPKIPRNFRKGKGCCVCLEIRLVCG